MKTAPKRFIVFDHLNNTRRNFKTLARAKSYAREVHEGTSIFRGHPDAEDAGEVSVIVGSGRSARVIWHIYSDGSEGAIRSR